MAGVDQIMYKLKCGQAAKGPETLVAGKLYCGQHECMEEIAGVITFEWRARCESCRFARWAGLSRSTADIFVTGHVRRNTGHRVNAEYAEHPAARRTLDKFNAWNAPGYGKHHSS